MFLLVPPQGGSTIITCSIVDSVLSVVTALFTTSPLVLYSDWG